MITQQVNIQLPNPKKVRATEFRAAQAIAEGTKYDRDFKNKETQAALETLIEILIKETRLLGRISVRKEEEETKQLVLHIAKTHFMWLRPVEEFRSKSHNVHKQLTELLDYLYAKYPRPVFLNDAFLQKSDRQINIFLHIAGGGNIRSLKDVFLPKLTKTQAHIFHTTPNGYSIEEAFTRAQALSYGVEERIIPALKSLKSAKNYSELLNKYFEFLGKTAMVDPSQVGPIWDYVLAHRTATAADGTTIPFSFKGRTITSLIQKMNLWHGELHRARINKNRAWPQTDLPEFQFPKEEDRQPNKPFWVLTEICTEKELHTEGKELHHCVYSYTESCIAGTCSIWSLKKFDPFHGGLIRKATIEVRGRKICQARKAYNAPIEAEERNVLAQWGTKSGITF